MLGSTVQHRTLHSSQPRALSRKHASLTAHPYAVRLRYRYCAVKWHVAVQYSTVQYSTVQCSDLSVPPQVVRINESMRPPSGRHTIKIGVLDIFGFEVLPLTHCMYVDTLTHAHTRETRYRAHITEKMASVPYTTAAHTEVGTLTSIHPPTRRPAHYCGPH
jgi:hypothetical protein